MQQQYSAKNHDAHATTNVHKSSMKAVTFILTRLP
jgi:hypothetical protein